MNRLDYLVPALAEPTARPTAAPLNALRRAGLNHARVPSKIGECPSSDLYHGVPIERHRAFSCQLCASSATRAPRSCETVSLRACYGSRRKRVRGLAAFHPARSGLFAAHGHARRSACAQCARPCLASSGKKSCWQDRAGERRAPERKTTVRAVNITSSGCTVFTGHGDT